MRGDIAQPAVTLPVRQYCAAAAAAAVVAAAAVPLRLFIPFVSKRILPHYIEQQRLLQHQQQQLEDQRVLWTLWAPGEAAALHVGGPRSIMMICRFQA